MNTRTLLLSAFLAGFAPFAQASLVQDLSSSIGTGFIEFNAQTGNDVSGVADFSFTANSAFVGGAHTFRKADIASVEWSIGANWELEFLSLSTNLVQADFSLSEDTCLGIEVEPGMGFIDPLVCGGIRFPGLSSEGVVIYSDHPELNSVLAVVSPSANHTSVSSLVSDTSISPSADPASMPEPSTVLLLGLGLAGLLGMGRQAVNRETARSTVCG
jgi:hypothetical protein